MELTFGEQVKIILKRKNMTIKELAEQMEAATGRRTSRQNLTQKLVRDNFQEQDMREIAGVLGCRMTLVLEDISGEAALRMTERGVQSALLRRKEEKNSIQEKVLPQSGVSEDTAGSEEEKQVLGDIDPATGKEYRSNTVRRHPSEETFVQIYDEMEHRWVDVPEQTFLDFQVKKREILGAEYEAPFFLY